MNRRFIGLMLAVLLLVAAGGVYFANPGAAKGNVVTRTVITSICCALTAGPTTTVFSQVTENIPTTTTITTTTLSTATTTATSLICCQTVTTTQPGIAGNQTVTITKTTTITTTPATLGSLAMTISLANPTTPIVQGQAFQMNIQVANSGPQEAAITIYPYVYSTVGGLTSDITFNPNPLNDNVLGFATVQLQEEVTVNQNAAAGASYNLAFSLQAPAISPGSVVQNVVVTLGQSAVNVVASQGNNQQNNVQTASCTMNVSSSGDMVVDLVASTIVSSNYAAKDTFSDSFQQTAYQSQGLAAFYGSAHGTGSDTISVTLSGQGNVFSQCYEINAGTTPSTVTSSTGAGTSASAQTSSPLNIGASSAILAIVRANEQNVVPTYSASSPFSVSPAGTVFNGFSNYDASIFGSLSSSTSCPVQLSVTDSWNILCIAIQV